MEQTKISEASVRFNKNIIKDVDGCWFWQGKLDGNGYAVFKVGGRQIVGHRWAYEFYRAAIPQGFVIDHLCRNRSCVNPDHLEPVTVKENNARAKTHCAQARHPLTAENIFITSGGTRLCRLCHEERRLRYRRRSQQVRLGKKQSGTLDTNATQTMMVIVPAGIDNSPLLQALKELQEQGLILDYR